MDRTYVEGDLSVTVLVHDGVSPVEGDGLQLHRPLFSNACRDSGTAQSMIETIDPSYYTAADGDGQTDGGTRSRRRCGWRPRTCRGVPPIRSTCDWFRFSARRN